VQVGAESVVVCTERLHSTMSSPSVSVSVIKSNQIKFKGKLKGSLYSITERRVPELIPGLGSQPAGVVSHKPGGRLPLLSARPTLTPATLKALLPILLLGEQRHSG